MLWRNPPTIVLPRDIFAPTYSSSLLWFRGRLFREREIEAFDPFLYRVLFIHSIVWSQKVFYTSEGISPRATGFCFHLFIHAFIFFFSSAPSSSFINGPRLKSYLAINNFFYRFIHGFRTICEQILQMFFPLLKSFCLKCNFLVLLSKCIPFHFLHLLSAMLILIVDLKPNFCCYCVGFEWILVVLLSICEFSYRFLELLRIDVCWFSFFKLWSFFSCYLVFY